MLRRILSYFYGISFQEEVSMRVDKLTDAYFGEKDFYEIQAAERIFRQEMRNFVPAKFNEVQTQLRVKIGKKTITPGLVQLCYMESGTFLNAGIIKVKEGFNFWDYMIGNSYDEFSYDLRGNFFLFNNEFIDSESIYDIRLEKYLKEVNSIKQEWMPVRLDPFCMDSNQNDPFFGLFGIHDNAHNLSGGDFDQIQRLECTMKGIYEMLPHAYQEVVFDSACKLRKEKIFSAR